MAEIPCPITQANPDQIAIQSPDATLTYRQLDAAIEHTSRALCLPRGARAAFIATPTLSTIIILFALFRLKAVACPLSIRTPPEQIPHLMAQCGAKRFLEPQLLNPTPTTSNATLDPTQLAAILMTSGSSGYPKAACLTLGNLLTSAQTVINPVHCTSHSRWLLSLPLFHVGGLGILFRCFLAGCTVVISDLPLDTALKQERITHASLVPTQLFRLLQQDTLSQTATCLLVGGAPLSPALAQKALVHNLPLFTTYGMTEMSSLITLNGKPLEGRELKIADDGEIYVRGKTLFQGYCNTTDTPLIDGWFPTKDLGKIDEHGNLTLLGRKDRMFISGGENIQPEEIESALCQIPGIIAAHIVAVDDHEFGKRPVAYLLEERPQHTLESIRAALRAHLPSFKHPIRVLPYTHEMKSGMKIIRELTPVPAT